MAVRCNWGNVDPAYLIEFMNHVSEQDGTVTFMFGGYGHYYKMTWKIGEEKGYASGETAEAFVIQCYRKLLGRPWSDG